jgi:catechol 2,3-dioxygenase-like lactoylglutathione lyase family enzyme
MSQTRAVASVRLSHVGLCVADLEASLRFYCEGLGFEVAEGYDLGDEVAATLEVPPGARLRSQMLRRDGATIELLAWTTPPADGAPPTRRNRIGLTHLTFAVEDLPEVEARLVAHGGTVVESTRTRIDLGRAVLELVFLADPDGTRIELMETRPVG